MNRVFRKSKEKYNIYNNKYNNDTRKNKAAKAALFYHNRKELKQL